jgi:hypothetical protein
MSCAVPARVREEPAVRRECGIQLESGIERDLRAPAKLQRRRVTARQQYGSKQDRRADGDAKAEHETRWPRGMGRFGITGLQCFSQPTKRFETVGWRLREGARQRRCHLSRHAWPDVGDRSCFAGEVLMHDRLRRRPGEGRLPGEHLVQQAAERVLVAAAVEILVASRLFGTHVAGCADRDARLGEGGPARRGDRPRDAEVRDDRVPALQQDVLRLDVAVDDAVRVSVVERVGHLASDLQRVRDGQLPIAREPVTQRLSLHEGHHVEEESVGFARVEQRQDVRVSQVRGGVDLAQEPLGAHGGGEFRPQHLHGDMAVMLEVFRDIHGGHAALPELALETVALGEGSGQTFRDGAQRFASFTAARAWATHPGTMRRYVPLVMGGPCT